MTRTGTQHRDSIRDGREVYMNGERVRDVATHPMFKPLVDIRARIYDMAHEAVMRDVMSYAEDGERHAIGNKLPHTQGDWWDSAAPPTPCLPTSASSPASATRRSARCGRCSTEATYRTMGEHIRGVHPVCTGLVVVALAQPEWLVEIDATAVIPD